jgi:hypothetical protein
MRSGEVGLGQIDNFTKALDVTCLNLAYTFIKGSSQLSKSKGIKDAFTLGP